MIEREPIEYDENGKLLYHKWKGGLDEWYDSKGNLIHSRNKDGYDIWYKVDEN